MDTNKKVPAFKLMITEDRIIKSQDLQGKNIVLYFYPKDNTPGCTLESRDFAKLYPQFKKANTEIFGISRDSIKSHAGFKAKCDLPFDLACDKDESLCQLFDVLWPKNMFGKIVNGIVRSTFLIDANGVLRHEWRKVSAAGHAQEVLQFASSMVTGI